MFKKLLTFTAIIMLSLFLVIPAQAGFKNMWAQVYSWDGSINASGRAELTEITSGITFQVLQAGSDTIETLLEYGTSTSLTNPVTTTNYALATKMRKGAGVLSFRVDPGETNDVAVDLIVVDTSGGYTAFVEDFDQYTHSIIIDERPNIQHSGTIWFTYAAGSATEIDTGIDFDYDSFIHDVWVEPVTVDSTETIDVGTLSGGTDGDANGFRALVSVATAGFVKDTGIIVAGSTHDYVAASTYGADLVTAITGTDAGDTDVGGKSYIGHVITGANEQSLTYTLTAGSDTAVGYIHYLFTRLR